MTFVLLTGIVFIVVPVLLIAGFSFFIFLNFVRDDNDAKALLNLNLIAMVFGVILVTFYFVSRWLA